MYISANHYLSADSGKTSSPSTNKDNNEEISSEIVKPVMNKKTQLEKYLQPLASMEDNVEFRTVNPIPSGNKKLGMRISCFSWIISNFIFLHWHQVDLSLLSKCIALKIIVAIAKLAIIT